MDIGREVAISYTISRDVADRCSAPLTRRREELRIVGRARNHLSRVRLYRATLGYSKIDHSMQKLQYLDAWDLVRYVSQGLLRAPQKPHSRRHGD